MLRSSGVPDHTSPYWGVGNALYEAPHLEQAIEGGGSATDIIKRNAAIQANLLAKTSTVLAPMVKEGKLKIQGAYFELATGRVTLL